MTRPTSDAIATALLLALREVAARKPAWSHFGHVFVTHRGSPPHGVNDELTATCERLGLPRITPHSLRHASLTILADAGVAEDIRQRRAGHSTTAMSRHYTSTAEAADRTAADALDHAIGG